MGVSRFSINSPFSAQVALGQVSGWSYWDAFGKSALVTSTTSDLWNPGGTRTLPSSAATASVVSTSANDDGSPAGTGVQSVLIEGLDGSYVESSETLVLNGVGAVTSSNSYLRINRLTSAAVGSGGVAAGNITASISGNNQARILAGENRSRLTQYTVPASNSALFQVFWGNTGPAKDVRFSIQVKESGAMWITIMEFEVQGASLQRNIAGLSAPAQSDIRVRVTKLSASTTNATGGYSFYVAPS